MEEFRKALNDFLSGKVKADGTAAAPFYKKADKVTKSVFRGSVIKDNVDVTYKNKLYKNCRVRWEPKDFDQRKSTVRIVHRGKHYIVWFYDDEISD